MYTPLSPFQPDFYLVRDLMIAFSEYVDTRFAQGARHRTSCNYEPGDGRAE